MRFIRVLVSATLISACSNPTHEYRQLDEATPEVSEKFFPMLSPPSILRKLSYHIKGQPPTDDDYAALESTSPELQSSFFKAKAHEYLSSKAHVEKMNFRLNELFSLRPQSLFQGVWEKSSEDQSRRDNILNFNALNEHFRNLAKFNLSWDQLAVGKSYSVFNSVNSFFSTGVTDAQFYAEISNVSLPGAVLPGPQDPIPSPVPLVFKPDDPRIAGAITTTRFFARYTTTALNRNRRRAAAIFRVFLCDEMKAAIPQSDTKAQDLLNLAYPESAIAEKLQQALKNQHGSNPACMACHYKLDPLGNTFQTSPVYAGAIPSAGELTFKNQKGDIDHHNGAGIGDLMEAMIQTPEYASCQVKHFWNWFIGEDMPLSPEREAELTKVFNRLGRKTNDFIEFLVLLPEFKAKSLTEVGNLSSQVQTMFKRCASCHSQSAPQLPDFSQWPIGGSTEQATLWLSRIRVSLGFTPVAATMPPPISAWVLSDDDKSIFESWLSVGAPDVNGNKQIKEGP